jgi:hypothetical protein
LALYVDEVALDLLDLPSKPPAIKHQQQLLHVRPRGAPYDGAESQGSR